MGTKLEFVIGTLLYKESTPTDQPVNRFVQCIHQCWVEYCGAISTGGGSEGETTIPEWLSVCRDL